MYRVRIIVPIDLMTVFFFNVIISRVGNFEIDKPLGFSFHNIKMIYKV